MGETKKEINKTSLERCRIIRENGQYLVEVKTTTYVWKYVGRDCHTCNYNELCCCGMFASPDCGYDYAPTLETKVWHLSFAQFENIKVETYEREIEMPADCKPVRITMKQEKGE